MMVYLADRSAEEVALCVGHQAGLRQESGVHAHGCAGRFLPPSRPLTPGGIPM